MSATVRQIEDMREMIDTRPGGAEGERRKRQMLRTTPHETDTGPRIGVLCSFGSVNGVRVRATMETME